MSSSRLHYPTICASLTVLFLFIFAFVSLGTAQDVIPPPEAPAAKVDEGQPTDQAEKKSKLRRFEVGIHGTIMFQSDFEAADVVYHRAGFDYAVINDRRYESGIGGRLTYNINRQLAVETEVNYTPGTKTLTELAQAGQSTNVPFSGGEKTQVLFGAKYGYRGKRFGVFAKVRPGFIHFRAFPYVVGKFVVYHNGQPYDMLVLSSEKPATFFNADVGGVFEYYTSKRTMIRFDIGDTIIHYNAQKPRDVNPTFTRHNLQMNFGFGFRF